MMKPILEPCPFLTNQSSCDFVALSLATVPRSVFLYFVMHCQWAATIVVEGNKKCQYQLISNDSVSHSLQFLRNSIVYEIHHKYAIVVKVVVTHCLYLLIEIFQNVNSHDEISCFKYRRQIHLKPQPKAPQQVIHLIIPLCQYLRSRPYKNFFDLTLFSLEKRLESLQSLSQKC